MSLLLYLKILFYFGVFVGKSKIMRNLKLLSSVCFEIEKSQGRFSHISIDEYTGSFYAATDNGHLVLFDPSIQQVRVFALVSMHSVTFVILQNRWFDEHFLVILS